jgi:nitrogen fixation NifU-like protein
MRVAPFPLSDQNLPFALDYGRHYLDHRFVHAVELNWRDHPHCAMYHPLLLQHFQNPQNVGTIDNPSAQVEVSNPICGDILRLAVSVAGDRIVNIAFLVKGCTASVACGSALTELLKNQPVSFLDSVTSSDIERAVGELPQASRHAATLCVESARALSAALAR